MTLPWIEPAFANGEITPSLFGRVDVQKFSTAAGTIRNAFVDFRGGVKSRAGTAYVAMSKQSWINLSSPPRLITFNFSLQQNYCLEFGDNYMRIYSNGAPVVENAQTITAISIGANTVLIIPGNNYAAGDWIILSGMQGTPQFNGNTYIVKNVAGNNVTLEDYDSGPINSTGFGSYVASSGIAQRIYTISTPYLATDIWLAKFVQSANVMTFTNPNFPPYNLNRFGPLNWQFQLDVRGPTIGHPTGASATANVPAASVGSSPAPQPAAYSYEITAVSERTGEESEPSNRADVNNSVDMASTLGSITVTWSPVQGASFYNVYRAPTSYSTGTYNYNSPPANAAPVPIGSLYGIVAQTPSTQLVDTNLTPDFSQSPPMYQDPLAPGQITFLQSVTAGSGYTHASVTISTATGSGFQAQAIIIGGQVVAWNIVNNGKNYASTDTATVTGDGTGATAAPTVGPTTGTYPSVVSYFQQRRVYANSFNQPDTYWMSQTGSYDNFDVSIPVGDSDAITGTPSGETVDGIQWMLEMPLGLVTFTGALVEQITAAGTFITSPTAITPSNQLSVPQSTVGSSSTLQPIRIDWNILHYEPDNAILRELNYQIYFNIYISRDISWQSSHLTFGYQILDRAWARRPNYVLWHVRNDGVLLSTTYVKDQEVVGWAKHTTQGQFQSVAAVFEAPVDALYTVVQRPIVGSGNSILTRYYIERMDNRQWFSAEDPWCVDCGVATNVPNRAGFLFADNASGNSRFFSNANVFTSADVGATIRMGGGIAVVTRFITAGVVQGTWVYPCQQTYPDNPNNQVISQSVWSIRPPIGAVAGLPPYSSTWAQITGLIDGVPLGTGLEVLPAGGSVATAGQVTLPFPASNIKLGLGFGVQVQSIYLDVGNPTVQGRVKALHAITVRVVNTAKLQAGSNQIDASTQNPQPLAAVWGAAPQGPMTPAPTEPQQLPPTYTSPGTALLGPASQIQVQPPFTGDIRVAIPAIWAKTGQAAVQQLSPQPLNVLAFVPEFDEGDLPEQGYSQRPPREPALPPMPAGAMARWPGPGASR